MQRIAPALAEVGEQTIAYASTRLHLLSPPCCALVYASRHQHTLAHFNIDSQHAWTASKKLYSVSRPMNKPCLLVTAQCLCSSDCRKKVRCGICLLGRGLVCMRWRYHILRVKRQSSQNCAMRARSRGLQSQARRG